VAPSPSLFSFFSSLYLLPKTMSKRPPPRVPPVRIASQTPPPPPTPSFGWLLLRRHPRGPDKTRVHCATAPSYLAVCFTMWRGKKPTRQRSMPSTTTPDGWCGSSVIATSGGLGCHSRQLAGPHHGDSSTWYRRRRALIMDDGAAYHARRSIPLVLGKGAGAAPPGAGGGGGHGETWYFFCPHSHRCAKTCPTNGILGIVGKVFSRRSHLAHLIKA
jgi:hypothetical protein